MKKSSKLGLAVGVVVGALMLFKGKKKGTDENTSGVGAVRKNPKFYVYAGYYELYISAKEMPKPYVLLKTFRSIDRAIEYAESYEDTIIYCDNVKDYLPDYIYEVLQDNDYEFFDYDVAGVGAVRDYEGRDIWASGTAWRYEDSNRKFCVETRNGMIKFFDTKNQVRNWIKSLRAAGLHKPDIRVYEYNADLGWVLVENNFGC